MRFGTHGRERGKGCGHHGPRGGFGPGRSFGGFGRGGFGGMRGDHEGGGRGRRRVFDGTELRLVLLKLIEEQPRHGYDLIREIEQRSGGAYAPSPGVVYPTLTMLDDMELVAEQKAEGSKKSFAITEAGQAHLAERAEEVAALFARLAHLARMQAQTDGGPIRRAMSNLRAVLQNRLSAGSVESDTLHEVAAILDEAARRIERL